MQKRSRVVSALALCLAILSSSSAVSAAPPTAAATDNGAFVILGKPPGSGPIEFRYGWNSTSQFTAPPVGYWLGIYDNTRKRYVWSGDNELPPLNAPVGSSLLESVTFLYSDPVGGLPPGEYFINFFVRSSYAPATNVAVVTLTFTVK